MKNLVYLNRVNVDYKTLYAQAQDYFKRHRVELSFDFKQTDYKNLSYVVRQFPQGQRVILQPTMSQVVPLDPAYDFVSFLFNGREFPPPNIPTGYCYGTGKQPFMDILTDELNPKDLDYVTICHEMMHALVMKANQAGFPTPDVMDTYYLGNELENPLSNFGQQWALLKPWINGLQAPISPVQPSVTITRLLDDGKEITGQLRTSDGKFGCYTLELSYKGNQPNISAIPKGTYKCVWSYMNSLKEYHYQLQAVPNRTGVFLHEGNFATGKHVDIEGCILLGGAYSDIDGNGEKDIINSRLILSAFEKKMNKQDFVLEIK